jgi:hypothetical protein
MNTATVGFRIIVVAVAAALTVSCAGSAVDQHRNDAAARVEALLADRGLRGAKVGYHTLNDRLKDVIVAFEITPDPERSIGQVTELVKKSVHDSFQQQPDRIYLSYQIEP